MTIAESTGYRGNIFRKAAWLMGIAPLCLAALAIWVFNGFR